MGNVSIQNSQNDVFKKQGIDSRKNFFKRKVTMKRIDRRRGFTLVELLIVVVIIAVSAALVMPRFLNQSQRVEAAEGLQMISAMRRTALSYQDAGGPDLSLTSDDSWEKFGLKNPNPSTLWIYSVSIVSGQATLSAFYLKTPSSGKSKGCKGCEGCESPTPKQIMRLTISPTGSETWSCPGMKPLYDPSNPTVITGCQF
jgi:prepilin-type N-terminal cleavage/methylation domain-containing protein